MSYHILGIVSSLLFLMTWYGHGNQLIKISGDSTKTKRQHKNSEQEQLHTTGLSANQVTSSYFVFFASFLFALSSSDVNHYLVWKR